MKTRAISAHDWLWLVDELLTEPEVSLRRMFGCVAFYKGELLMLMLTGEGEEPWNGVCVCTDRARHPELLAEFPSLVPHPVLGKWLYLSCAHPSFEADASALVTCVLTGDSRLGVPPNPKRRKAMSPLVRVKKQKTR